MDGVNHPCGHLITPAENFKSCKISSFVLAPGLFGRGEIQFDLHYQIQPSQLIIIPDNGYGRYSCLLGGCLDEATRTNHVLGPRAEHLILVENYVI